MDQYANSAPSRNPGQHMVRDMGCKEYPNGAPSQANVNPGMQQSRGYNQYNGNYVPNLKELVTRPQYYNEAQLQTLNYNAVLPQYQARVFNPHVRPYAQAGMIPTPQPAWSESRPLRQPFDPQNTHALARPNYVQLTPVTQCSNAHLTQSVRNPRPQSVNSYFPHLTTRLNASNPSTRSPQFPHHYDQMCPAQKVQHQPSPNVQSYQSQPTPRFHPLKPHPVPQISPNFDPWSRNPQPTPSCLQTQSSEPVPNRPHSSLSTPKIQQSIPIFDQSHSNARSYQTSSIVTPSLIQPPPNSSQTTNLESIASNSENQTLNPEDNSITNLESSNSESALSNPESPTSNSLFSGDDSQSDLNLAYLTSKTSPLNPVSENLQTQSQNLNLNDYSLNNGCDSNNFHEAPSRTEVLRSDLKLPTSQYINSDLPLSNVVTSSTNATMTNHSSNFHPTVNTQSFNTHAASSSYSNSELLPHNLNTQYYNPEVVYSSHREHSSNSTVTQPMIDHTQSFPNFAEQSSRNQFLESQSLRPVTAPFSRPQCMYQGTAPSSSGAQLSYTVSSAASHGTHSSYSNSVPPNPAMQTSNRCEYQVQRTVLVQDNESSNLNTARQIAVPVQDMSDCDSNEKQEPPGKTQLQDNPMVPPSNSNNPPSETNKKTAVPYYTGEFTLNYEKGIEYQGLENTNCPNDEIDDLLSRQNLPIYWCSVFYYELDTQIGDVFVVDSKLNTLTIDGYLNPCRGSRFCLGALNNLNRTFQSTKVRLHIGKGVELKQSENGDVWLTCLSSYCVYVQSYYLDRVADRRGGETVHKIHPTVRVKVFDLRDCYQQMRSRICSIKKSTLARARTMVGPSMYRIDESAASRVASEIDIEELNRYCILRLSFAKGWGPDYPKAEIKETPCWVEIQLHRGLQLLDMMVSPKKANRIQ